MSGRSKCAFADYVAYFLNSCFDLKFERVDNQFPLWVWSQINLLRTLLIILDILRRWFL